jgi:class 3 adenylate cyclase
VRWLADRLPEATLKVIGGTARQGPGPPLEDIFEEVEEFLVGTRGTQANRQVMSLLFTDVVGSTATAARTGDAPWMHLLSAHRDSVRRAFVRFGGTEINTAGDGFLASFALPSSALRCAMQIVAESKEMGFEIRAGVHTGEVSFLPPNDLVGIAVHIAARVASLAGPSEILMTDTVRTLVAGTGIEVEPLGERTLKGVPGRWLICRLAFAVSPA